MPTGPRARTGSERSLRIVVDVGRRPARRRRTGTRRAHERTAFGRTRRAMPGGGRVSRVGTGRLGRVLRQVGGDLLCGDLVATDGPRADNPDVGLCPETEHPFDVGVIDGRGGAPHGSCSSSQSIFESGRRDRCGRSGPVGPIDAHESVEVNQAACLELSDLGVLEPCVMLQVAIPHSELGGQLATQCDGESAPQLGRVPLPGRRALRGRAGCPLSLVVQRATRYTTCLVVARKLLLVCE